MKNSEARQAPPTGMRTQKLNRLMELQKNIKSIYQWRQIEAVWLKEQLDLNGREVAEILNYKPQTVYLLWQKWSREGENFFEKDKPGGRKRAYLNAEEEKDFIMPFIDLAEEQGAIDVKEIKEEFQSLVGREVADSTIYRMLYRHGWNKKGTRENT